MLIYVASERNMYLSSQIALVPAGNILKCMFIVFVIKL